jgi:hypothetical protein
MSPLSERLQPIGELLAGLRQIHAATGRTIVELQAAAKRAREAALRAGADALSAESLDTALSLSRRAEDAEAWRKALASDIAAMAQWTHEAQRALAWPGDRDAGLDQLPAPGRRANPAVHQAYERLMAHLQSATPSTAPAAGSRVSAVEDESRLAALRRAAGEAALADGISHLVSRHAAMEAADAPAGEAGLLLTLVCGAVRGGGATWAQTTSGASLLPASTADKLLRDFVCSGALCWLAEAARTAASDARGSAHPGRGRDIAIAFLARAPQSVHGDAFMDAFCPDAEPMDEAMSRASGAGGYDSGQLRAVMTSLVVPMLRQTCFRYIACPTPEAGSAERMRWAAVARRLFAAPLQADDGLAVERMQLPLLDAIVHGTSLPDERRGISDGTHALAGLCARLRCSEAALRLALLITLLDQRLGESGVEFSAPGELRPVLQSVEHALRLLRHEPDDLQRIALDTRCRAHVERCNSLGTLPQALMFEGYTPSEAAAAKLAELLRAAAPAERLLESALDARPSGPGHRAGQRGTLRAHRQLDQAIHAAYARWALSAPLTASVSR